jgi:putative CocE/NonD family hydrolase
MEEKKTQGFDMSKVDLNNPIVKKMMTQAMSKVGDAAAPRLRPQEYKKVKSQRIKIELTDGVRLSGFLTMPKEKKAYPVILVRNPYVSNSFVYEGILPTFSKYGYATLLVEVRGTQTSEGDWLPFENEIADGRQVLDWIAAQPWCDGNIGCFGGSYLGHVQWAVANSHHPALKSLFVQVYGPTPYDTFWRRGMFRQDVWSIWVTQMMDSNRFLMAPPKEQLQECLTYRPQDQIGEHFLGKHVDWYSNWLQNSKPTDPYWSEGFWGDYAKTAEEIAVPILLEGGWNDIFLRPEIEAYRRMPENIRKKAVF